MAVCKYLEIKYEAFGVGVYRKYWYCKRNKEYINPKKCESCKYKVER